jgi:hypothetical protein
MAFALRSFWDNFGQSIKRGMPLKPEWFAESSISEVSYLDYDQGERCIVLRDGNKSLVLFLSTLDQGHAEYCVWKHGQWTDAEIESTLTELFGYLLIPYLDSHD